MDNKQQREIQNRELCLLGLDITLHVENTILLNRAITILYNS